MIGWITRVMQSCHFICAASTDDFTQAHAPLLLTARFTRGKYGVQYQAGASGRTPAGGLSGS